MHQRVQVRGQGRWVVSVVMAHNNDLEGNQTSKETSQGAQAAAQGDWSNSDAVS